MSLYAVIFLTTEENILNVTLFSVATFNNLLSTSVVSFLYRLIVMVAGLKLSSLLLSFQVLVTVKLVVSSVHVNSGFPYISNTAP